MPTDQTPVVDLDQLRAARRTTPKVLRVGGNDLPLVPSVPLAFLDTLGAGELVEATRLLFVDQADADRFLETRPDLTDLEDIVSHVFGIRLGESLASGNRSARRSRR